MDPYEALTLDPAEEVERTGLVVVDPDWEPDFDDIGDQLTDRGIEAAKRRTPGRALRRALLVARCDIGPYIGVLERYWSSAPR